LLALPAGIGVAFYGTKPKDVAQPIQSKYVLAHAETLKEQHWRLKQISRFRTLHNSIGYQSPPFSAFLYLNPAAVSGRHRP
jgi:hypothetical protein